MSQVQFSRSWSKNFGTHDRKSQARGFQFQDPVKVSGPRVRVSSPTVSGLRVPGSWVAWSQGAGSKGPRVSGLRVPGLESQVLILDYASFKLRVD